MKNISLYAVKRKIGRFGLVDDNLYVIISILSLLAEYGVKYADINN